MSPFASYPAFAQDMDETANSKAVNLAMTLNQLLDRAAYQRIPRKGPSGPPTASEMADVQSRLLSLKREIQNTYLNRVLQSGPAQREILNELLVYFEAVARYEGLKIMLGQPSDPEQWEALYNLKFPYQDLSQIYFLDLSGYFAKNAVLLPNSGYDKDKVLQTIQAGASFYAQLEKSGDTWQLAFRLNPAFAQESERLAFLMRPGMKSGLQFAAHFSLHRLYDSLALTHTLLRKSPETLPQPSATSQARFLSLRVKQSEARRRYETLVAEKQKPQVFNAILDTLQELNKQGRGFVLDNAFFADIARIKNLAAATASPEELVTIHQEELANYQYALSGLLNLIDLKDWQALPELLLREGKRLSLRHIYLDNPDLRLNDEERAQVSALIDNRSSIFAKEVLSSGKLQPKMAAAEKLGAREALATGRAEFQKNVETLSANLRDFEKQEVNFGYLLGAQGPSIQGLNPGPLVSAVVEALNQQKTYAEAYLKYKESLLTFLQAFRFKNAVAGDLTIEKIEKAGPIWNPLALKGKMPDKYIAALTPPTERSWVPPFRPKPSPRQKDLNDLLEIGRLLRFHVYETLNNEHPTLKDLKLDDTWLGPILRSDRRAYLEEMKKDLMQASPLIGGIVHSGNRDKRPAETQMLWEYLAHNGLDAQTKWKLVDRQLQDVMKQIYANQAALDKELASVDAVQNDDTRGVGGNMLVLATRASQIAVGLESFASFDSYYQELRDHLLAPGFARTEWEHFTTWSGKAMMALIGMMFLQMASSRLPVPRALDAFNKMLAPVFGPNFSRLTPFFYGLLGISLSDSVYRGWGSEQAHLETLRRYFECGSGGPCVAVYTDINKQTAVRDAPRFQAIISVATLVVIIGFFRFVSKLTDVYSTWGASRLEGLRRDMDILGIREGTPLTSRTLEDALRNTISRAGQQPAPVLRELGEVTARQAYNRIEARVHAEALRWKRFDVRFNEDLSALGIEARNWKDIRSIANALEQLEQRYRGGQILHSTYMEYKTTLMNVYQKMSPVWNQMEKDALASSFYSRVFDVAAGSHAVEIRTAQAWFDKRIAKELDAQLEKFYGPSSLRPVERNGRLIWEQRPPSTASNRFDQMLERVALEIREAPNLSNQRLEQLKSYLRGVTP